MRLTHDELWHTQLAKHLCLLVTEYGLPLGPAAATVVAVHVNSAKFVDNIIIQSKHADCSQSQSHAMLRRERTADVARNDPKCMPAPVQ